MIRWKRLDRGDHVVVGQHHALGRAGRAGREDQLERSPRPRGVPTPPWRTSQSGGKSGSSGLGLGRERLDGRRREAGQPSLARIGGVAAGPEDEVAGARGPDDALDRVGRHPQVERDEDEPGVHRAVVGGRQLRRRRRPGQDPVARLEVQRPQAPRRDPRPPVELAEAPVHRRAVVAAQPERLPIAVSGDGVVEQIEQGRHPAMLPVERRGAGRADARVARLAIRGRVSPMEPILAFGPLTVMTHDVFTCSPSRSGLASTLRHCGAGLARPTIVWISLAAVLGGALGARVITAWEHLEYYAQSRRRAPDLGDRAQRQEHHRRDRRRLHRDDRREAGVRLHPFDG